MMHMHMNIYRALLAIFGSFIVRSNAKQETPQQIVKKKKCLHEESYNVQNSKLDDEYVQISPREGIIAFHFHNQSYASVFSKYLYMNKTQSKSGCDTLRAMYLLRPL